MRLISALILSAVVLTACGEAAPEWQEVSGASGVTIELPAEPAEEREPIAELDAEFVALTAELNGDAWAIAEVPLPEEALEFVNLEDAVDGAFEGALAELEAEVGEDGQISDQESRETTVAGVDGLEFSGTMSAGDRSARLSAVVFVYDTTLVQVIGVDEDGDDQDVTDRVLGSISG